MRRPRQTGGRNPILIKWLRPSTVAVGALIIFGALLGGCVQGEGEATEASPGESPAGQLIEVRLTEYEIEMPATLPTGQVTFDVTNDGQEEHNFEVETEGFEVEFEENLAPGERRWLIVNLEPGEYEIYCPVDGHRDQGMVEEVAAE